MNTFYNRIKDKSYSLDGEEQKMFDNWTTKDIEQMLKDCGCQDCDCDRFMKLMEAEKIPDQIRLLQRKRCVAMDELHDAQKKVDCIDYAINKLKKGQG